MHPVKRTTLEKNMGLMSSNTFFRACHTFPDSYSVSTLNPRILLSSGGVLFFFFFSEFLE